MQLNRVCCQMCRTFKMTVKVKGVSVWYIVALLYIFYCCDAGVSMETCSTVVTVNQDREVSTDCEKLNSSLSDRTCTDLQDVLESIAIQSTVQEPMGCIEVVVLSGNYIITDFIQINQNLVLRSLEDTYVTFDFSSRIDPRVSFKPYFILSFANTTSVTIIGIDFFNSPGIIAFDNVTNVEVDDCTFRYFIQGAVDVYNCRNVMVHNCTFEHNGPVEVVKLQQHRGHAGGLSLGHHADIEPEPTVTVTHCVFRNNTSDSPATTEATPSQVFQRFIFVGRGGGCVVAVSPESTLRALFEDCTFEDNFARSVGGGLYISFGGLRDRTVVINRINVTRNRAPRAAGGLFIGFMQYAAGNMAFVYNSVFSENSGVLGGGVYVPVAGVPNVYGNSNSFARFENCTFTDNLAEQFGGALGTARPPTFQSFENIEPFVIQNCVFVGNQGLGSAGAVSIAYLPVSFLGVNVWRDNRGRTLVVLGTRIEVHGSLQFVDNDGLGIDGGALYITSLSQLELFAGSSLAFNGNEGVLGAAIVADTHLLPQPFSLLLHNPLCFIQYEMPTVPPDDWAEVSIAFDGNVAVVASAVYANSLNLCSWVRDEEFDIEQVFRWNFVNFSDNNINSAHEPDQFNPLWYVQTPATEIQTISQNASSYPGERFELQLKALDELGRPTASVIRVSGGEGRADFIFDPAVVTFDQINSSAINTSFYVYPGDSHNEVALTETILGEITRSDNFSIFPDSCPPGHVLSDAPLQSQLYSTCVCDFDNPVVLSCRGRTVLLRDRTWGSGARSLLEGDLFTYPCPLEYCRCVLEANNGFQTCIFQFNRENPDNQCNCKREGVLCGSCRSGYGVSALQNKCVTCHDASGLLIAGLIIADVVVFSALLITTRKFPAWIYPCTFYVQILPYLTEDFPLTFEKIQRYLYYVSSASSFYFVYDFCLYGSMSALVSYFLRYLPLIVAIMMGVGFILFRYYYKTRKWKLPWMGIWWMFLLQYSHVVHTSLSLLNCPMLPGTDGKMEPRWFVNGDIRCFRGAHVPLFLLAILVLFFAVMAIPVLTAYSLGWCQRPRWLHHVIDPLRSGFKTWFKWWPAVELARRLLLLVFIIAFPQNDYPAIFVLTSIIAVYGFLQPYEVQAYNVLETLLSLNIVVLMLLRNTEQVSDELQVIPSQSSTGQCTIEGVTRFSWLLLPLYFIPLAITVILVIIWIALSLRSCTVANKQRNQSEYTSPFQDDDSLQNLPRTGKVTVTELEIDKMGNLLVVTRNQTTSDGSVCAEHSSSPSSCDCDDGTGEYHLLHN